MSIYTKTGDKGTTSLFGGKRVSKSDIQVEAYGNIDELSSFLGLCISKIEDNNHQFFIDIQKDLYEVMGLLAGAKTDLSHLEKRTKDFENKIDEVEKSLPKLHRFILPGGNETSSLLHIARTVCRRAERSLVNVSDISSHEIILKYINRLSDLFFIMARFYGKDNEIVT